MRLPAAPAATAPDAIDALHEATGACRDVHALTAEVAVAGKAGGQRLRARLSLGLSTPASIRIEAVAPFGAPAFILVARGDDASLLMPREREVIEHARPDALLDALVGLRIGAADLDRILTGCAFDPSGSARLESRGDGWRVVGTPGDEVYLHRAGRTPWQVVALTAGAWRADFADRARGVPQSIRLVSLGRGEKVGAAFDLRLTLSQIETNTALGPEVFRVEIPPGAKRITIDELQHARPGIREN